MLTLQGLNRVIKHFCKPC